MFLRCTSTHTCCNASIITRDFSKHQTSCNIMHWCLLQHAQTVKFTTPVKINNFLNIISLLNLLVMVI
jgi:hypothetical protein